MITTVAIIAEIAAVHETNVRSVRQRHFNDFAPTLLAEIIMRELHHLLTP